MPCLSRHLGPAEKITRFVIFTALRNYDEPGISVMSPTVCDLVSWLLIGQNVQWRTQQNSLAHLGLRGGPPKIRPSKTISKKKEASKPIPWPPTRDPPPGSPTHPPLLWGGLSISLVHSRWAGETRASWSSASYSARTRWPAASAPSASPAPSATAAEGPTAAAPARPPAAACPPRGPSRPGRDGPGSEYHRDHGMNHPKGNGGKYYRDNGPKNRERNNGVLPRVWVQTGGNKPLGATGGKHHQIVA